MNSRQLQYAVALYNTRSFSQVSEELGISQPALSKQIQSLEKELGIQIFDRNTVPFTVTVPGEAFIRHAKQLLNQEQYLLRVLEEYKTGEKGRLTVGASPFRCLYLIPPMVKKLQARFPGVEFCLRDTDSERIRKELSEGNLDFAIVNLPVDDRVFDYIPLEPDTLVLAVPNKMLDILSQKPGKGLREIDFKDCRTLPFIAMEQGKEMRGLFDSLCSSADFYPQIVMEVVGITTAWTMAQSGIGATVLPLQFVNGNALDNENITLFTIKDNTFSRQPVIITRKGQYLSAVARHAIDLLQQSDKAD